jgi:hypothetical protein
MSITGYNDYPQKNQVPHKAFPYDSCLCQEVLK